MKPRIEAEYDVKLDDKKRTTLRGTKYSFFHVKKYSNGSYLLEPRELIAPEVLAQIDSSIKAFKSGETGTLLNLDDAPDV